MGVRAKQSLKSKVCEFATSHTTATSPGSFYEKMARKLNINRTDAKTLCDMQGIRLIPTTNGPYEVQLKK